MPNSRLCFGVLGLTVAVSAASPPLGPGPNGLARTPPMGWMSWEVFRCETDCVKFPDSCVNAELYKEMAESLHTEGYLSAGYNTVSIDDCWEYLRGRDKNGKLVPDPKRFPDGMKDLADYMHARGVHFGIYSDEGTRTCGGFPGSEGHEVVDANTFAAWDVDYLKFDGCYNNKTGYVSGYPEMGSALQGSGRAIVYSCSWPAYLGGNETAKPFGAMIAAGCNSWRNWEDIQCDWGVLSRIIQHWGDYGSVLARWAGPGHWHDPDMLLIGNGCLTVSEERTQMALWSILAAPLIMGNDLRNVSAASKAILLNPDAIAVSQDPLGRMGVRVKQAPDGSTQVWARELRGGDVAVALYNKNAGTPWGIALVAARCYCSSTVGVGSPDGFGHTLTSCRDAVRSDTRCKSGYFDFNADYNGQCKCATDDCSMHGTNAGYNIYRLDANAPPLGINITFQFADVGITAHRVRVRNIWTHQDVEHAGTNFTAQNVSLHGTAFVRLSTVSE